MAFRKMQRRALEVATRADRMGKHELAEKIRTELFCYSWTKTDIRISIGIDIALTDNSDSTLEQLLPSISEWTGLSETEIKAHPRIQELFTYNQKLNNIGGKD